MKEKGQMLFNDIVELIEHEVKLWVRIAAIRQGEQWNPIHLEITSGVPPTNWVLQQWNYDDVVFLSCDIPGTEAAKWLRTHKATIGGIPIQLTEVQDNAYFYWHKQSSLQSYGKFESILWPSTVYQLPGLQRMEGISGLDALVGDGPSFISFVQAAATYFGNAHVTTGFDNPEAHFRLTDLRGRITKVLIKAGEIEVHVEGSELEGAMVELASVLPGPSVVLSSKSSQFVRFTLPNGIPDWAWIVLKKGSEWIDRKFLNIPYRQNVDAGVEIVVEQEIQLEAMIAAGEGPTVEFKSDISEPNTRLRKNICKTVAAFANGDGGRILFGVCDDGTIIGIEDVAQKHKCDTVTQFISSMVTPVPALRVDPVHIIGNDGLPRTVIVLSVEQGEQPPYAVNYPPLQYCIRRGATTFEASSHEVRNFARSRPAIVSESQSREMFL
ncbi:ATP-binding protein [Ferrimicrobium sp.]|uniref:AlbA family DNA-binding domain-containing protein n=1 Tax=Ferrimicrobium sp. TaxID=2926050 RepID=UPI0026038BE2|nr:ATP-binding protein [Ferrimicrobium sp.]